MTKSDKRPEGLRGAVTVTGGGLFGVPGYHITKAYEFSAVAKWVGLDEATVKNWTNGRPLEIEPSLTVERKQGKRNLYSYCDVLRFAIAKELVDSGFHAGRLKPSIEQLSDKTLLGAAGPWRFLAVAKGNKPAKRDAQTPVSVEFLDSIPESKEFPAYLRKRNAVGVFFLDMAVLQTRLHERYEKIGGKR